MAISDYLDEGLVSFLNVKNKSQALKDLVETLDHSGKLHSKVQFHKAILKRENIVSTGIGLQVAIPHAKLDKYKNFFIAIGIQKGEGIEWNALDGLRVHLIFMIGGPDNKQTEYLNILSSLTMAIKDPMMRQKLIEAKTAKEVVELFKKS